MKLSAEYETYIRSPEWRAKRAAALERDGHRCRICNSPKNLDVHHRTYERLGNEDLGDLTVLCRGCHDVFHDSRSKPSKAKKRRAKRAATELAGPVHRSVTDAQKSAEDARVAKLSGERQAQRERQREHKQELAARRRKDRDWRDERKLPRKAA